MEVITLGNPYLEDYGTLTPIEIPAYEAEKAIIKLSDGYIPYSIGEATNGATVRIQVEYVKYFTVSNNVTDSLIISTSNIANIKSLTVNGIEFYENIDFTLSIGTVTFEEYLPYDSEIGDTNVRIVYTLYPSSTGTNNLIVDETYIVVLSGIGDDITTGDNKAYFDMPHNFHITNVIGTLRVAPVGSEAIFDIKEAGTSILSTLISIDSEEYSSTTAAIQPVISDSTIVENSRLTFDIVQIGTSTAGQEAIITIEGYRI